MAAINRAWRRQWAKETPVCLRNNRVSERPLAQASQTLDDLRAGKIVGRVVLTA